MVKKTIGLLLGTVLLVGSGYNSTVGAIGTKASNDKITAPENKNDSFNELIAEWNDYSTVGGGTNKKGIGYNKGNDNTAELETNYQIDNVKEIGADTDNYSDKKISLKSLKAALNEKKSDNKANINLSSFAALEKAKLDLGGKGNIEEVKGLGTLTELEITGEEDFTKIGDTTALTNKLEKLTLKNNKKLAKINLAKNTTASKKLDVTLEGNDKGVDLTLASVNTIKSKSDKFNQVTVSAIDDSGNFDFSSTDELKKLYVNGEKDLNLTLKKGSLKLSDLSVELKSKKLTIKDDVFDNADLSKMLETINFNDSVIDYKKSKKTKITGSELSAFALADAKVLKNINLAKTNVSVIGLDTIQADKIKEIIIPAVEKEDDKLFLALGDKINGDDLKKVKQKIYVGEKDNSKLLYDKDGNLTNTYKDDDWAKGLNANINKTNSDFLKIGKGNSWKTFLIVGGVVVGLVLVGVGGYVFYKKRTRNEEEEEGSEEATA